MKAIRYRFNVWVTVEVDTEGGDPWYIPKEVERQIRKALDKAVSPDCDVEFMDQELESEWEWECVRWPRKRSRR